MAEAEYVSNVNDLSRIISDWIVAYDHDCYTDFDEWFSVLFSECLGTMESNGFRWGDDIHENLSAEEYDKAEEVANNTPYY